MTNTSTPAPKTHLPTRIGNNSNTALYCSCGWTPPGRGIMVALQQIKEHAASVKGA